MEDDEDCNIRVICRFRPVNKREIAEGGGLATQLTFPTDKTVEVSAWNGRAAQTFNFDKVFYDPSTTQEDIYELAAKKSIEDVIKGYNSTIFAYGQTGAGKSFTMFGPDILVPDLKGIIPRSCMHIFQHIANDREGTEYTIKCSFLEIYKENVRDLLNPSHENKPGGLRIREAPGKGVWVEGLHEAYVASEEDVLELIKAGERNRAVSSTAMNAVSSRSHSLFILTLHQKTRDGSTKEGKLNLADLAGSEKVGKTGATGETLEEAKKINQSLSALGNCINALTKSKKAHVPYRDSKLTFILRESLGGNCKTTLLIACSPHVFNLEETISTLMFGKRAKTIKNSVKVNKQRSVAELMAIIEKLKKEISGFKRYISILEQELEKVKGPNWRDDLPKTARPAPPPTAEEEPSRRTASSDDTGESGDSELSDGGESLVSKSQPNLSAPRENAQTPSNNRSHHQRNSSVQGGDDEYDQVFTSTANMSLKLAELQVELQNVREKLQLEIDDLTEEKKSLTTDLESKSKKLSLKKELVKEKESQLKALRAELDAQHQAKAQLEEKLTYEIKQLQITTEDQNKSMELISSHNAELRLKSQTLSQELEDLQENNARLQTEHDRLKREISELVSAEQRKQTRIQELESNLAEYESEYKNMRNLQLQLELTNKTLTSKLETATGKSESLAAHSKEIESKLKVASADKQALESHVQNLNAKIIELEADLEELRSARLQRQAENEQLEELRASFVEKAEFERISKEREKLKAQLAQANSQAQEERDLVHSLKDQLEKAQEAHLEQLEQSKAEYEASLERLTSSVQLLEASLAEEQQVNSKKFRTLEEKSQDLASQCELEKQARSRAEQALLEQSEQLAAKEKLLRRAMSSSDDKDRELTQQTSLVQSQARTLAAQEERIKKLELELEERTKERELLQQEIKTALEINIENAKQFEQQLTVAREETQLRPQNIRVPISNNERGFLSSIFGGRQLPVLGEIKTPVKFGYLLKRSNWLKVWEKRWFVLTEKNLFYYETNNLAAKAAGEIEIDGCKVAPAAEFLGRPNTFGILHKSRKEFYLQASSEEDCMDWMRCIHNSIHGKAPTKAARPTSVIIPRGSQSASNVTMIPPS